MGMKTLVELVQERAGKVDALEGMVKGWTGAPSAEQKTAFDAARDEVAALDGQIAVAKAVEDMKASQATLVKTSVAPVAPVATPAAPVPAAPAVKEEPGFMVARFARALAATKGNVREAGAFAAQAFGESHDVTKALSAGVGTAGGYTIPTQFVPEVIELLRARTVVRSFNPTTLPLVNGSAEVPKLTGGSTAGYIGENQNAPKTEPNFGMIKATAKKLAALVPMSNDLLRYNAVGAETIVRNDLVAGMAGVEDVAFMRSQGSQYSPKGLRYWAPAGNIIAANATVNVQNVKNDLGKLQLALVNANVRLINPGWIMAPRTWMFLLNLVDANGNSVFPEVANGMLRGYPFKVTTAVPTNLGGGSDESEIAFVDFADVVIADAMTLTINVSDTAAYHDGTQVQASFSLDQTVIRVIAEHDLVVRHEESIAYLTAVKWTP